jgi:hypothetical protein
MIDFNILANLYDFSLIEDGVQAFFVALPTGSFVAPPEEDDPTRESWAPGIGQIPFYTPRQALVIQAARPRIGILETNFSEIPGARILDADGIFRASAWRALMKFSVITMPNYKDHRALRGAVAAILPQLQPNPTGGLAAIGTTGVNAFLKYHQVGQFAMQSGDTRITPSDGYYFSTLSVNLTFSVDATAWPGGTVTP